MISEILNIVILKKTNLTKSYISCSSPHLLKRMHLVEKKQEMFLQNTSLCQFQQKKNDLTNKLDSLSYKNTEDPQNIKRILPRKT
uniref:Uncharacterized protein n=1 Tax=Anguilla anguilla TaxID=7936 RepID=A0A0E9X3B6_ANGAN